MIQEPRVQHVQGSWPQTIHYAVRLRWRVVLWHLGSHLEEHSWGKKEKKKGTHVDALTLQPAQGLKIIISPQGNERTWTILLLCCAFVSTAHVDDILFTGKGCMAQFEVHTLICIPTLFSLGGVNSTKLLVCVCVCVVRACSTHKKYFSHLLLHTLSSP